MSNTRNICNYLTNGFSDVKESVRLRPDEARKLVLPIVLFTASATLLAFPSAAYAVFAYSLLPSYTVRAVTVGSLVGVASIVVGRLRNENRPSDDKLIESGIKNYASLVKITGGIDANFSSHVLPLLKKAFQDQDSKGVVLKINSTGGSAVQSSIIYNEILKLKKQYKKKVIAVGEDHLASGAYYIASSADAIYVNPNTITGSIGVVSSSYGLTELAKKLGVEPRVHTAGPFKHRSDSLLPESKEDTVKIDEVLKQIHDDFSAAVLATRKDKLKAAPDKIFSGDYWTGKTALDLGLVDHLGNLSDVLEIEFGVVKSKEYESHSVLKSIFNLNSDSNLNLSLSLDQGKLQLKM